MKVKKVPIRQCLGCMEGKPKKELLRIVKNAEGEVKLDLTGKASGRGAYICNNVECFVKLKKKKGLNRAFQQEISDDVYNKLNEELSRNEK